MKRLREFLQVKFLTALTIAPILLRWFATWHGAAAGLEPAFLGLDQAGWIDEPKATDTIILVPVYLVMCPIHLKTDGSTLWPLSPFYATIEAAQRFHAGLARKYPRCAVQSTLITLDPRDPYQRGAIESHKKQLIVEQLQNVR